jgi:hypothetical protein
VTLVRLWYIIMWPQSQWPIEAHIPHMLGFRQRYMNGSKACRFWENMVKDLEIMPSFRNMAAYSLAIKW